MPHNDHSFHTPKANARKAVWSLLAAFLLLSLTLGVAVAFVVDSARSVSMVTQAERSVTRQRRATDHLLNQLLNAGTQAEVLAMQYADNAELRRYLRATMQVDTAIVQLRQLVTDSTQILRIDSLQTLASLRRDGVVELVNALRRENHRGSDLQRQIAELHSNQRPIHLKVPVMEHDEQVVIERRRRGFFRRLGDAFRKAKDDTVQRQVRQGARLDDMTHAQVDIADTLADMLTDVHQNLQRDSLAQVRRLHRRSDRLRAASAELSHRMAALVDNFTATQQRLIAKVSLEEKHQRTVAARKLGAVAVVAVLFAGLLMVWLGRDIRRSNRYRRTLERLMTQREQLLLTISHDIKAPVNSMLGYLRLLPRAKVEQLTELQAIEASAKRLLQLVTALLDYHKLDGGDIVLHPQPTDMAALLHDVATAFHPLATQKGLQLQVALNGVEGLWIRVDDFRLRQIVENLLGNAIKYTAQGEVSLKAEWDAGTDGLRIEVADTGCGLSEEDLDRIFQPFTRVKGSEGQEGAGLGLSITQRLAECLGGGLEVHSEYGRGSCFAFSMQGERCAAVAKKVSAPSSSPDLSVGSSTEPSPASSVSAKADCVAVLDDDALQLQLTEAMLRNVLPRETDLVCFQRPDALFGWLDEGHVPTVVMTDIEMPAMTGYEVLEALRRHTAVGRDLRVIAMTSHLLVPVSDFKQRGFADVLFKPFTQNDLLRVFHASAPLPPSVAPATDAEVPATASAHPFAALLAFAEGDPQSETAILQQFANDCRNHLDAFSAAFEDHRKEEVCRIAHKMLPTFTLISSPAVPALQELERRRTDPAWQPDDEALCRQVLDDLKRVCRAFV